MLPGQVEAEEPVDPTKAKANERVEDLAKGRATSWPYEFTKTRAELRREKREKREERLRRATERVEAAKKQRDAEDNEPGPARELMERLEEAKKRREPDGQQKQVGSRTKDASRGTGFQWVKRDSQASQASQASQFLPNTHQIGGS